MPARRPVRVELDVEGSLGYVQLSDREVDRTVSLTDEINLDLDTYRMVVGIEVLDLEAEMPFTRLVEDYHVPEATVEILRLMRPSMSEFHGRLTTPCRVRARTTHHAAA